MFNLITGNKAAFLGVLPSFGSRNGFRMLILFLVQIVRHTAAALLQAIPDELQSDHFQTEPPT